MNILVAGYRFLNEEDADPLRDDPPANDDGLWKKIWSLDCPNKVKHFLWRACKNSLPSKSNLVRRKMIQDHTCDRCLGPSESVIHALWSCLAIDFVWEETACWDFRETEAFQNCSDLVAWIFRHDKQPELFSMIAWSIWTQRNQIRTMQQHCSANQIAHVTRVKLEEV